MLNYLSSPLPLPAHPLNLTLMYQALFSTLLGCVEVLEVSHLDPSSLSVGGTQQCGSQINSLRSSALVRSCAQSLRGQRNRRVPGELSPPNLIISGPLAQLAHSREGNIRAKWGQPTREAGAPRVPGGKAWGSASAPLAGYPWVCLHLGRPCRL